MNERHVLLKLCMAVMSCALLEAQIDARMFRYPDVSRDSIAFVYAGDIWVVSKRGGTANRLSSPRGEELFPRFSPDGSSIAFTGNYDGNGDVYVIPALGGEPKRITHHPSADRIVDWTPDGRELIFASSRASGVQRFNQLYRVPAGGGLPARLPLAYGEFGMLSPDGSRLVFTTKDRGFRNWKRYRGGMAPEIWMFELEKLTARNLSNSDANDSQPMWHNETIYFLSDRGPRQRSNIWACRSDGSGMRQLTRFEDVDVTFPAIGPADIVFQAGGRLYLLSLSSEKIREVEVDLVTDMASVRPRSVTVGRNIQSAGISPAGKRAVFAARGELFTLPAQHGPVRQLTRTSGAAERYPAWSPDGKRVAYWCDESGEYELTLKSANGNGPAEKLTALGPGYRYNLFWSPDSRKVAFIDNREAIQVFDLEGKSLSRVDQASQMLHGQLAGFEVAWSPDSRWITYSRALDTGNNAVFIHDTQSSQSQQVTSGYYSDSGPVFDPDGNYLYYLSNRSYRPIYSDMDATWVYPNSTRIVAVSLRRDVPSPLAPRNDEEGKQSRDGNEEKAESDKKQEGSGRETHIDPDGFERRGVVLPPRAGNFSGLRAVPGKVIFHRRPNSGDSTRKSPIVMYDLKERKETPILEDASGFEISADGKSMLVVHADNWAIVKVAPKQKLDKRLALDRMETRVEPEKEWRQIFNDVWRTYRDYFYDPNMHGLDWDALRTRYLRLLDDAVTRWDVNFVIGQLIAEVNASHTYVGGGDQETPQRRQVGLLGVDWALENGAYRIARIVKGAPWDIGTRSPLAQPGAEVSEGDYILAVNGVPIDPSRDPYAAFEGLAGRTVSLSVNGQPSLEGSREVLVETLRSESRLRNLEWIESNRRRVDEATNGRVGYIFVPNTGISGQSELVRQFNSQMRRDGLIIDERFNSGGQLPDRFVELMSRQLVTRLHFRNGTELSYPPVTHYGHKVMLINGWAGSGGDAFPFFFKEMGVGPLIGERTWGGLIGPAVGHRTIDGGFFTAPPGRLSGPRGTWFPEGHGVEPDLPVVDDPGEMARGRDPQLEAAIREVMRMIREDPPGFPDRPPWEKRVPKQ